MSTHMTSLREEPV